MSDVPTSPPPMSLKSGMAITALVFALLGFCFPLFGLVGLILGIIALTRANNRPSEFGGKGLAIAGISVGGASLVLGCVLSFFYLGIMLPALGKARQAARQIKSGTQIRSISQALMVYADENHDAFPEVGADLRVRLGQIVDPAVWESPSATPGEPSYLYVGGQKSTFDGKQVLLFENPALNRSGTNVGFGDLSVQFLAPEQWRLILPNLKDVTTDTGKPWILPSK
ncbi:MAG: DUF4190 domain-containing protein [Phycisphaeraceae bacterium]|nr:DUF4190 domain-containing protein [Phycisphaeraceae bacterium]